MTRQLRKDMGITDLFALMRRLDYRHPAMAAAMADLRDNPPFGIVYSATTPSGKQYFGQTIRPLEERIRSHKHGRGLFPKAVRKYGERMIWSVVLHCNTQAELNEAEQDMIRAYKTLAPHGYNLTTGGDSGGMVSDITKRKLSAAHKGRKHSPEHIANQAASCRGKKRTPEQRAAMREVQSRPEQKEAISKGNKGKKRTPEQKAAMRIAAKKRVEKLTPEEMQRRVALMCAAWKRPELRQKQKEIQNRPEVREKKRRALLGRKCAPRSAEYRAAISQRNKERWANPAIRAEWIAKRNATNALRRKAAVVGQGCLLK